MKVRVAMSGVLALNALLVGCSSPLQSTTAVHRTTSSNSHEPTAHKMASGSSVTFNPVISRAMNILLVPPHPLTPLYAPTIAPIPSSPNRRDISAFAYKSKVGKDVIGYSVNLYWLPTKVPVNNPELLNRYPTSVYAGFGGSVFPHSTIVNQVRSIVAGNATLQGHGNAVDLGNDIVGRIYRFPAEQGGHPENIIEWQEGRWNIQVLHYNAQTPLVFLARQMVAYLHTHFLPAPDNAGAIQVSSEGPQYTHTKIAWNKDDIVYQVFDRVNPLEALKIAVSMRLFVK